MAEINASIALSDEQVISVGVNPSFYRGESARPNFYFDEITSIPYGDTPSATVTGEYPNYYISMEIPRGADGDAPTIQVGNVTTGSTPSVTVREVEGVVVLDFVFPVPPMPNITIGTVQESSSPSVTISGTTANPILNFGLVKGDAGTGISSIELTSGDHSAGTTDTYTITLTDGTTALQEIYNGSDGVDGTDGATGNGIDYISRTSGTGMAGSDDIYTIYYTNGTTGTFTVHNGSDGTNGADGEDGEDGFSPTVEVSQISGGHQVEITDADGTNTFNVMDGTDGQDGADGTPGQDGENGADGEDGKPGTVVSSTQPDYDAVWVNPSSTETVQVPEMSDLNSRVAIAQGTQHAGKLLGIGSDGNVSPILAPSGSGDMMKAVYDSDDDGKVDEAEVADALAAGSTIQQNQVSGLSTALAGKQDVIDSSHKLSYSYLSDTPTIPSEITEQTVAGWGFTKNTGTYLKPSTGIPKTDLDSAVQTSLGKADTAYQKASSGIPKSDLASAVQTSLGKADSALQTIPTASQIAITDTGSYFSTDNVEAALQQVGAALNGLEALLAAI